MDVSYDHLLNEQRRSSCILGVNFEMLPLTRGQQAEYDASTICKCCNKPYCEENWKVCHHNHSTGCFISAVCNTCNLKLKPRKRRNIWNSKMNKKLDHLIVKSLVTMMKNTAINFLYRLCFII